MPSREDTITAIATPAGQAGIGIIRISGPRSYEISKKIFRPKSSVKDLKSHNLYLGYLYDPATGGKVDEVMLSYMKSPHSYTREDVIEIIFHKGYLLLSRILRIILDHGARLAEPGEFTLKAFLNGRIDLTQAEAVMNLINSQSEKGIDLASQQIGGSFRKEIEALRQQAVDILARVEVAIDFPEQVEEIIGSENTYIQIGERLIRPVEALIKAHKAKKIWVDGISAAIVGYVNTGKSSLLNRLLNEERAIVTPIPGTTRDIIESTVSIEGVPLRLMDTAGLREGKDEAEKMGIYLTGQKLREADLLLVVIDRNRPLNRHDLDIIARSRGKKTLIALNKIDLPSKLDQGAEDNELSGFPVVKISALTGQGIDQLKKAIVDCIVEGDIDMTSSHAVPNLRHRNALMAAKNFFDAARQNIKEDAPMEIAALELKSGLDSLGEIIGETAGEEVLDSIFSRFCLGK